MTFDFENLPQLSLFTNKASGLSLSYRLQEPENQNSRTQTLVFLHGLNGSSKSWYYQFAYFKTHRIISIDAPGFGASSVRKEGMEEFSNEIVDFLEYLKVKSTILIGNSMGGMLSQILAHKLADKCKGLFLSCTYKGKASHQTEPLAKNYEQRISERNKLNDRDFGALRVDRMLAGPLQDDIREFLTSIAGEIRSEGIEWGARAIQYLDTSPFLKKLNNPVLILSGENDIVVKPDALEALVASLPTAHHKKMSSVGHAPYCENSSEFNQILDSFIITCSNR